MFKPKTKWKLIELLNFWYPEKNFNSFSYKRLYAIYCKKQGEFNGKRISCKVSLFI